MRILAMSVAGFCLLISAGDLLLLFLIPSTSVSLSASGAGSHAAAAQSWATLLLLLTALLAAAGVLVSLWRQEIVRWKWLVSALACFAGLVAILDYAVSRYMAWVGPSDVPWLNMTVVAVAILYLVVCGRIGRGRADA